MSASMFLFDVWLAVCAVVLLALLWESMTIKSLFYTRFGETTLGRNSINWLAGFALTADILLCCLAT